MYLWNISLPGNNGTPRFDLSKDEASCVTSENLTSHQILIERVINKTFADNSIPLDVSDTIRATFRTKLWRMGKLFAKLGTKNRNRQLEKWKEGKDSIWKLTSGEAEVTKQLLSRKRSLEENLQAKVTKRQCLEQQLHALKTKVEQQQVIISKAGLSKKVQQRKPLEECSRQQIYNRKKEMVECISTACRVEGYEPCSLEVVAKDSNGERERITLRKPSDESTTIANKLHSSLYVKDKFSISNEAYNELSSISDLPNISKVRRLSKSLNSTFSIVSCPSNITGVQTSLRARILYRLQCFVHKNSEEGIPTPNIIRIKLTGDGTRIA